MNSEKAIVSAAMRVHYQWAVKKDGHKDMTYLWYAISRLSKACASHLKKGRK